MNILFLIDPNSIHDLKWATYFSTQRDYNCYFICRKNHFSVEIIQEVKKHGLLFLGTIDYLSISRPTGTFIQLLRILGILKKYQIDLFHIQYAEPNALWTLIKYFKKVPVIVTTRGTDVLKTIPEHFAKKNLLNQIVRRLYKVAFQKADWVTVTSKKQWTSIQNFSGRVDNYSIIRTGVDIDNLKKDTSSFFRKELTKPFILFPRYIKPLYNHEFCIKAIENLSKEIKTNYQMVFIGKDTGNIDYQKALIKSMNINSDVEYIFLPKLQQKELWELYKKSSLVVMTPLSDGSPVSGMESLVSGKNLILGPLEYDPDIFVNKLTYILKNWDSHELQQKIEDSLKNKNRAKLKDRVILLMDRKDNMKRMENIYHKVNVN